MAVGWRNKLPKHVRRLKRLRMDVSLHPAEWTKFHQFAAFANLSPERLVSLVVYDFVRGLGEGKPPELSPFEVSLTSYNEYAGFHEAEGRDTDLYPDYPQVPAALCKQPPDYPEDELGDIA